MLKKMLRHDSPINSRWLCNVVWIPSATVIICMSIMYIVYINGFTISMKTTSYHSEKNVMFVGRQDTFLSSI